MKDDNDDFRVFEMDNGAYIISVAWFASRGEMRIAPEFRMSSRISLGALLRGLGITLEDCQKALEQDVP